MARCTSKTNLEVHHIRRDGGNGLNNAKVLCQDCHSETDSYGKHGNCPPDFSDEVKAQAKALAGNQCECTSNSGCH